MRRRQGSANCSIGAIEVSKWISSFAPAMQLAESAVHHSPNMIRGCFGVDSCHWYWYVLKAVAAVAAKARAVVGDGPIYISIDVDGFDAVYAPGIGTPEVGGITPREGLALLRALGGLDIIGADVVEVAPQYDPSTNTAQLAAQLLFEEFSLMTLGRNSR
jgi:hypothetical protein